MCSRPHHTDHCSGVTFSKMFVTAAATQIQAMADIVHILDGAVLCRATHALESSAAQIGAILPSRPCAGLETQAEASDLTDAMTRFWQCRTEFALARNEIEGIVELEE